MIARPSAVTSVGEQLGCSFGAEVRRRHRARSQPSTRLTSLRPPGYSADNELVKPNSLVMERWGSAGSEEAIRRDTSGQTSAPMGPDGAQAVAVAAWRWHFFE